jgi:hypothetical protein
MMEKPNKPRVRHRNRPTPKTTSKTDLGFDPHKPIGYANPPRSGQFTKGNSGNPKGRPRGSKSLNAMIEETLLAKVRIRIGGVSRQVTQLQALLLQQMKEALEGNAKARDGVLKLAASSPGLNPSSIENAPTFDPDEDKAILAEIASWNLNETPSDQGGDGDD